MSRAEENYEIDAYDERSQEVPGAGTHFGEEAKWLQRAWKVYQASTDYYESSLFQNWRDNVHHFRSEHAPGSKYSQDAYKHRSKIFRPKPRSSVRSLEASAAASLFANNDLISVEGTNPSSEEQTEAAKLHQALLQHRLEVTIPWFLTVVGAYQDTHVYGLCISRQYWDYRVSTETQYTPAMDDLGQPMMDESGLMLGEEHVEEKVLADKPAIDMIAPENFRFDPACDWRRPVESSPYLIEVMPMYVADVMAMMEEDGSEPDIGTDGEPTEDTGEDDDDEPNEESEEDTDGVGEEPELFSGAAEMGEASDKAVSAGWRKFSKGQIISHGISGDQDSETVRYARHGSKSEDTTEVNEYGEYSVVWIHFNIIRDSNGEDYAFYTVGTGLMLTEPKKLEEVDPIGRDRYAVGFSNIESHVAHPEGTIGLNRPLTEMNNDVTNQRLDNVKLALNKRYAIRRGSNIDLGSLMRNVPGGGVMMDDPINDYRIMETPDVTQSSYVEQDRLSVESDELMGNFSQSSVSNNRNLNETVGGMNMMAQGANQIQELALRTFIETWVEPVLRTMVKLESLYETDEAVMSLAADKAEIQNEVSDDLMMQDLVVRVNVGMGNTNPQQKLARFLQPLDAALRYPDFAKEVDMQEVGKEIFSIAGLGDGERFMLSDAKKQERAEAAAAQEQDPRVKVEQMRQQEKQIELEIRQMEAEQKGILEQLKIETDREVDMAKIAADRDMKLTELYEKLGVEQQQNRAKNELEEAKIKTERDIAALKAQYDQLKARLQATNLEQGYDTF